MATSLVHVEDRGAGLRILTLNRPEKRNALNVPLLAALVTAIEAADRESSVRCLALRGAGAAFCAGLDLREAAEPSRAEEAGDWVARALAAVHRSPKVTIAAVHGAAMAGGAGLMACCDIVVAAEGARIGFPEVRRGLVAALVMSFLTRRVRESDARELLLLAEPIDARRALEIGLVNRVVPPESLMDETLSLAESAARGAPEAIARTKQLLDALRPRPVSEDLDRARDAHHAARASGEAQEGIAAYLEKRSPQW